MENREALTETLQALFASRLAQERTERLLAVGVPCGPVNRVDTVLADRQVLARDMVVEVTHPTAGPLRLPLPVLGQHTEEVLRDVLGYGPEEIAALKAAKAV